jgi:hypothetical protein
VRSFLNRPVCNHSADHDILRPRDGKDLTIPRIEAALMEALHMSGALAHTLASGLKPLVRKDGTLDLVDTRTHNVMEHDRSPTRLDTRQGDNWTMQPAMLDAMLADAGGGPMTIKSMAKTLARRKREHVASGGEPMPTKIVITNLLMTVSFINVEQSGAPTPENVRQFWTEERFQDYILNNPVQRTLHGLLWRVGLLLWYLLLG